MTDTLGAVPAVKYCGEPTESGEPCRQVVGIGGASGKCLWHDESRRAEATAVRRKGGEASHTREPESDDVPPPPEPKTLEGVCAWLSWVTVALARGQIDKSVATGATYALQNLKAALALRDLERGHKELEKRMDAMESQ